MKHVTNSDLLEHEVNNIPLPCDCEECRRLAATFGNIKSSPERVVSSLPDSFWHRQEDKIFSERRRFKLFIPVFAAAVLILAFGIAVLRHTFPGVQEEKGGSTLTLKQQELFLEELEILLDEPPLGDIGWLVEEIPSRHDQSDLIINGGYDEA